MIVLGTPVWWYTFAPAVHTFLTQQDLSCKTVYPFATNGGWIGHTFADIEKSCKGAEVKEGMNIRFDEDVLRTSEAEIDAWIRSEEHTSELQSRIRISYAVFCLKKKK